MPPDALVIPNADHATPWRRALVWLTGVCLALFAVTLPEWREMAHQWWDIDTYNHILLVPPIIGWLVWLRRDELAVLVPDAWALGLVWFGAGLLLVLLGRVAEVNLIAAAGAVAAAQGAVLAFLGVRIGLVIAFPLAFAAFLVPFGDELIPAMQAFTAHMTLALLKLAGIPSISDGLFIDTPGGKFVVAEECSGVKFLIAMVALTTLVGWTAFGSWRKRIALVAGAAITSILANVVRAWGTIVVAQRVGAERAGGFDHIVYGWVFFAVVIAAVFAVSWRHFDRVPEDAGLSARDAEAHPLAKLSGPPIAPLSAALVAMAMLAGFAALAAFV